MSYYSLHDDNIAGPWEPRELIEQPGVTAETMVCTTDRFSHWVALDSIPELKLLLEMRGSQAKLVRERGEALRQVHEMEDQYEEWTRSLHEKIKDLHGQLKDKMAALDDASQAVATKGLESDLFKKRLTELKSQYLELQQYTQVKEKESEDARKELRETLRATREELSKAQDKVQKTHCAQNEREKSLREAERTYQKNNWEMRHMEDQWQEVHRKNKLLQEEKVLLQEELQDAKKDWAELRSRLEANTQEVREAPARAMKAELEAESLRETLHSREGELKKVREEMRHQTELAQSARMTQRDTLDNILVLENRLKEAENRWRDAETEIVRLKARAVEREAKSEDVLREKNEKADILAKDVRRAEDEANALREETQAIRLERTRLETTWRARETELRNEIILGERQLYGYRRDNNELEQRCRKAGRDLKALQEKEDRLHREQEKLKGLLQRREARIEAVESYLKDPEAVGDEGATVSAGRTVRTGAEGSGQEPVAQAQALKGIESRMGNLESLNQLLRDNVHQMIHTKPTLESLEAEWEESTSRRFATWSLWFLWSLLVVGLGALLYHYLQEGSTLPEVPAIRAPESRPRSAKRVLPEEEPQTIVPAYDPGYPRPSFQEPNPIKMPGISGRIIKESLKEEEKSGKITPKAPSAGPVELPRREVIIEPLDEEEVRQSELPGL